MYSYSKIYVPHPDFDSNLTLYINSLEKLRNPKNLLYKSIEEVGGAIFLGLKGIFQIVESISSARIEGNRTTVSQLLIDKDYSKSIDKDSLQAQKNQEIWNIYDGIEFINNFRKSGKEININRFFLSELHQILMKDLKTGKGYEGDNTPGEYRVSNVSIINSPHKPVDYTQVNPYMEELLDFIENEKKGYPQFDLLKVAIAHHRFVWIHPYGNGNGRMVRLLTYAMLIKYGFDIWNFGLLNPSTLFCLEREKYYDKLSKADSGDEKYLLEWCEFAISGIWNETEKLELLGNKEFVINKILYNAIKYIKSIGIIDDHEEKILKTVYNDKEISAKDVKFIGLHPVTISNKLLHLKKVNLIAPVQNKKTIYEPIFKNNDMFKAIFYELSKNGFDTWLNLDKSQP